MGKVWKLCQQGGPGLPDPWAHLDFDPFLNAFLNALVPLDSLLLPLPWALPRLAPNMEPLGAPETHTPSSR